jgi:predicted RNA-binding Zn ribbon-like protein
MSTTTAAAEEAPGRLELVRQFINTADIEHVEDELVDLDALAVWLRKHRLLRAREHLSAGDLERALNVREALRDLLEARDGDHRPRTASLRSLNSLLSGALLRGAFASDGALALGPAAGAPLDRALAELVAIIVGAAGDGSWERLKVCADHGCRWAFYDRSKNHSRSWCNMAVCGNRAKAREYRRRRRGERAESVSP